MSNDVVKGPKLPLWGCQACGRTSNWACRVRCRCGAEAPSHVLLRAKSFGGNNAPNGGAGGAGNHFKPMGGRQQDSLNKLLAAMQKQLDGLTKQQAAKGQASVQGGNVPGVAGGADDKDKDKDKEDSLAVKARELEAAIKACNADHMEENHKRLTNTYSVQFDKIPLLKILLKGTFVLFTCCVYTPLCI